MTDPLGRLSTQSCGALQVHADLYVAAPAYLQMLNVASSPARLLTHDKHSIVQGIAQAAFVAVLQHKAHLQRRVE